MSQSQFPDYYRILNLSKNATQEEVRQAYRKESLKTHPDRLANATPAEARQATERFQAVADAYYVLSDTKRRQEYDSLYQTRGDHTTDPGSSSGFFSQFSGMFGAAGDQRGPGQPNAEGVFADVFEELLRPEINRRAPWWSWLGAVSGAGIGFIVANVPGLMVGAYAGNRLGAVREMQRENRSLLFSMI